MDKKNTLVGVLLIGAAIALMFWNAQKQPAAQPVPAAPIAAQTANPAPAGVPATLPAPGARVAEPDAPEQMFALESDFLKLNISSRDGAVKSVVFKKQPSSLTDSAPVVFNADASVPALSLAGAPAVSGNSPLPLGVNFSVEAETANAAEQTRSLILAGTKNGLKFRRIFTVSTDNEGTGARDPYFIGHKIEIAAGENATSAFPIFVSTGTLPPTEGDRANIFFNASYFNGDDYEKIGADKFSHSSGFFGLGGHDAAREIPVYASRENPFGWVAVTNQYFAGILTFPPAARPSVSQIVAFPEPLKNVAPDAPLKNGVVAYARLEVPALAPGQRFDLEMPYFAGPKEYVRMAALCGDVPGVDHVVQFTRLFGFIGIDWLCKILVYAMNTIHDILPGSAWSWGWAILVMTLIVKLITWPLTMAQQRSAKKMQQFQEPMKQIREKYKDNPQKQQQEMMKLYREHKINPLAGCFPVLIQIPIFFGMYCAFQTCAELRLQGFLWIPDLSMPDVVPGFETLWGFPVHILPILMGATMILNMRLTPMPNSNPGQKQMFYAMMVIFPVICYSMPSALTLYWTMQNIFTMFQTWLVRRSREKGENSAGGSGSVEIIPPQKRKGRGKSIPATR